jgi:hypothetical protein
MAPRRLKAALIIHPGDRDVECLFQQIGALTCSRDRFGRLLEAVLHPLGRRGRRALTRGRSSDKKLPKIWMGDRPKINARHLPASRIPPRSRASAMVRITPASDAG